MSRKYQLTYENIYAAIADKSRGLVVAIACAVDYALAHVVSGGTVNGKTVSDRDQILAWRSKFVTAHVGSVNTFNQYWADALALTPSKRAKLIAGELTRKQVNHILNRSSADTTDAPKWMAKMEALFAKGTARQQAAFLAKHQ